MSIAKLKLEVLRGLDGKKSKNESAPRDSVVVKVPFSSIKYLSDVSDSDKLAKTIANQAGVKFVDSNITFDSDTKKVSISFVTSEEMNQDARKKITDATLRLFN